MDPFTHGLIGITVGILGGGRISLSNGIMMAVTIGSVIPDLDIVCQIKGHYNYIKQHRGFSHSFPGAVLLSMLGSLFLSLYSSQYSITTLFCWTFIGVMTHLLLDLMNSYGVKILWPLINKKFTFNLIPIFDPLLIMMCLLSIFLHGKGLDGYAGYIFLIYLLSRWGVKSLAKHIIMNRFKEKNSPLNVAVIPSGAYFFKWDFIIELPHKNIVGTVHLLRNKCKVFQLLNRERRQEISGIIAESVLGKLFKEFTPFYHINYEEKDDKIVCHFIDLRYRLKGRFLHNGTMVLSRDYEVMEAIFHPYSMSHRVYLV